MKTKIYLNDWFFNAGIVGFLRILEHNKDNFVLINENYIEFDTANLKNFHQYYFNYFFDTYNLGKKTSERIEESFGKINKLIITDTEEKDETRRIQEQIKTEKKYIKSVIKTQMDKIKKIDEQTYNNILEKYNEIDNMKDAENIKQIQEKISSELLKDSINKKITLNLFKSILGSNYFGQMSFLNVIKSALSYEEQEDLMYKDYISNIIETNFLIDIEEGKYEVSEIIKLIKEKQEGQILSKDIISIYQNIIKQIEKGKDLGEVQKYIREKAFSNCCLCENERSITSNYSEGNFVPLAVSSDNMRNFFWNQNVDFPICDICKLILFCTPVGITTVTKTIKENTMNGISYKEKEVYSFVNYDTDVNILLKTNNSFAMNSKKDKNISNPYSELILNIVEQDKKISEWQLQNIFVIEFETEYRAYSRMEYFNIKRYVARFFKNYAEETLNPITDYRFKLEIVDYILKNKDISRIINERLQEEIRKDRKFGFNCYLATKVKTYLEILKKEGQDMNEQIKSANAKLHVMFTLGNEIYDELKKQNNENKLDSYIYKMLNCIKGNRKDEFTDTAIRVIWSVGKDVPEILVKNCEEVDWKELGHSFISGLTQSKYIKNQEVKENE